MNFKDEAVKAKMEQFSHVGFSLLGMECRMGMLAKALEEAQSESLECTRLIEHIRMKQKFYYLMGTYVEKVHIHEDKSIEQQIIDSIIETGNAILDDTFELSFLKRIDCPEVIYAGLKEIENSYFIELMVDLFEEDAEVIDWLNDHFYIPDNLYLC